MLYTLMSMSNCSSHHQLQTHTVHISQKHTVHYTWATVGIAWLLILLQASAVCSSTAWSRIGTLPGHCLCTTATRHIAHTISPLAPSSIDYTECCDVQYKDIIILCQHMFYLGNSLCYTVLLHRLVPHMSDHHISALDWYMSWIFFLCHHHNSLNNLDLPMLSSHRALVYGRLQKE